VLTAGLGGLLPAACRQTAEAPPDPTPAPAGAVIGHPNIPPLLIAAPGGSETARPVLVEFTRQNPSLLARWEMIGGDYAAALEARFATAAAPDVIRVREGQLGRWRHAGLLSRFGTDELFEQLPALLYPGARAGAFGPDGSPWGIPHYHDAMFLAYNQAHLERLGGRVPATLGELAAFARELQARHSLRNPVSINLAPKTNANLPWWGLLKAAGASFEMSGASAAPAAVVLEALRAMVVEDGTLDPGTERPDYDRLADGDCAFAIVGAYSGPSLTGRGAPIAYAPLPGVGKPGLASVCWTPLFALVNREEPHPAAAMLAVHLGLVDSSGFLWGPRHFALAGSLPPAYRGLLSVPEIRTHFGRWIDPGLLAGSLEAAEPVDFLWEPWFRSWEYRCQELTQIALLGQTEPETAIAGMVSDARRRRELSR
jgi:ABC-type glycerol-3-phosphate transport system substrate-binding protein